MKKFLIITFVFTSFVVGTQTFATEGIEWKSKFCSDTDGGNNPYLFGNTTLTNSPNNGIIPSSSDTCYSSLTNIHSGSCSGVGCQVMENYCVDIDYDKIADTYNSTYIDCPNGCYKGACIVVKDTDPSIKVLFPSRGAKYEKGQQIFIKWETQNISKENKNFSITLQEYDEVGLVIENYKLTANTINDGMEIITLPKKFNGSGAINNNFLILIEIQSDANYGYVYAKSDKFTINKPSSDKVYNIYSCEDTDDGYDIYEKGKVTWGAPDINKLINTDYCTEETTRPTTMTEFGCINNSSYSEVFDCPLGCSKGACILNKNKSKDLDLTPRISYWQGKVNQHIDINSGEWQTDPDGVSGAELDKLAYCKKWYPLTESVREYKKETIETWRNAHNTGQFNAKKMSYECVQSTKKTTITSTSGLLTEDKCLNTSKSISKTLKIGMIGDEVKFLQQLLDIKDDGIFGTGTLEKVKEWQRLNNLNPDGIFGARSLEKSGINYIGGLNYCLYLN